MRRSSISIIRLKRCFICRPLAAMLAVMLVPIFSGFEGGAGVRVSQASAGVIGGSNTIIQNYCVGHLCYIADLGQLERDAVNAYLGLHNLPPGDSHNIYDYGRADLRNAVRGVMFTILLGIINKPASQRTKHEQALYQWLQGLVQQNEIEEYRLAIDQFNSWQRDPCRFTLDPNIASQYGLSYNGAPFCNGFALLFSSPQVPDQNYFIAYGLENSYGKPAFTHPYFGRLVADTGANVAAVAGIAAGASAVVLAGAASALVASLTASLAAIATGVALVDGTTGFAGASAALIVSGSTVQVLGTAFLAAGPIAIIVATIAIGVAAGIQAYNTKRTLDELNNLNNTLTQVTNTAPDLSAFATDPSGLGMYKLQAAMDGQTVPELPSTAVLPPHSDSDLNFAIQKSTETRTTVGSTLSYLDWTGINWSAQTFGGWFVQTCNSGRECPQADSINANLRYVDWSGVNWTAARVGDKFVSTKNSVGSTDKPCPADPATGVSTGPDFAKCVSYVSTSIPLKAPGGVLERVSLSVLPPTAPPVFTSAATLPFTPSVPSNQTIIASGSPSPQVCFFSIDPPLPPDFALNGGVCGNNGRFQVTFNGDADSAEQTYALTLAAANGTTDSPLLRTFTIDVSRHLGITSPGSLDGTAGFPVNFLVTTTGFPPPSLSFDSGLLGRFPGLKFTDNGNGTGTLSGTPTVPGAAFCPIINGKAGCGVVASNSQGTVIQGFLINLAPAPSASLGLPTQATFVGGAKNSVVLTSTGASTHVVWKSRSGPSWITLLDNGNGTAILQGTPPAGTSGTFSTEVAPIAVGSTASVRPVFTPFPVRVVSEPLFVSSDIATLAVGLPGSFSISASEGTIDLVGTLPNGLSFTGGNPAGITGTPAPGTGGQYHYNMTLTLGSGLTVYQSLTLNVYEAPMITSPNKATFPVGLPGSFAVTTSGFPSLSREPLTQPLTPPTSPGQGKGMYLTVTGLPASLRASNLDPQGFATGTLTIQGTPLPGDAGSRLVQIAALNGFGPTARQTLTLNIVGVMGTPPSGIECDGAYNGVFEGNVTVVSGQNCMFVGGSVKGTVVVLGGDFTLSHARVTGNVAIQGRSGFSIGQGSEIDGNLIIENASSAVPRNPLCESTVKGSLLVGSNAIPIEIGSFQASCPGNFVGQSVVIMNNTKPINVDNNFIAEALSCTNNLSIAGGGNLARNKFEQCAAF